MTNELFTPGRRKALQVVALHDGAARISNSTDPKKGLVYWQSAAWLVAAGYAAEARYRLSLTPAGRKEAVTRQMQLPPPVGEEIDC